MINEILANIKIVLSNLIWIILIVLIVSIILNFYYRNKIKVLLKKDLKEVLTNEDKKQIQEVRKIMNLK
jgi:NADH:ubiquinone oxidoreductase subunit 2 (subunit N)